ncbi:MAG: sulfotransferase [Anaerolineales bacterium]
MRENLLTRTRRAARVLLGDGHPSEPIPSISSEEIEEARRYFPKDKFFIFGHARSGTTLLARLLRLHPDVHCSWQAHFFTQPPLLASLVEDPAVREWLVRRNNRWNRGKDPSPVILRAVADFILEREADVHEATIVGDKSPSSMLNGEAVRNLVKIYPDCRLLVIVRDPRDTLVSHRFQAFLDAPHTLTREDVRIRENFRSDPTPYLNRERSIFTERGVRQASERWVVNVRDTLREGSSHYGARFRQVRFEDLLAQPVMLLNDIWGFLGANTESIPEEAMVVAELRVNPDAEWQHEKDGSIARYLAKGKSGAWKQFLTERDIQIVNEVAGAELTQLGYSGA